MPGLLAVVVILLAALGLLFWRGERARREARIQVTALKAHLAREERGYREAAERWEQRQQPVSAMLDAAYDALLAVDGSLMILECNRRALKVFPRLRVGARQSLNEVADASELETIVSNVLIHNVEVLEEQITIDNLNYNVKARVQKRNGQTIIGLALRDITQLVRLNRARRDMVANISHELRTPIANIRLIIDSLFHERERPKRQDSIQSLHEIGREAENLLWLVQEMSDLSMIESGQAIVKLVEVPLNELVTEAIGRLIDQSETHKIRIEADLPESYTVLCDRDLARRVLVNLIHNAIKWTPPKSKISIAAAADREYVTISVIDEGPGVPADQVDRIFERFYQVDASRSEKKGGTGLGLAICRHIVEAHGGRIWVESGAAAGGGVFRFTLLNAASALSDKSDDEIAETLTD